MTTPGAKDHSLPSLAARAQLGGRAALEELLRRLQHPLAEHIRGIVRDDDLAADVLQDTLLIICRRLSTVREPEWVRAWAYRVATREALRSSRRARRDQGEPLDGEHAAGDEFERSGPRRRVGAAGRASNEAGCAPGRRADRAATALPSVAHAPGGRGAGDPGRYGQVAAGVRAQLFA